MQAQEDLKSVPQPGSESSTLKNSAIFIQNACLQHRYIRSKDLSSIVERPERLRAVNVGLAAAIARLEELFSSSSFQESTSQNLRATLDAETEDLAETMQKMNLDSGPSSSPSSTSFKCPVTLIQSQATLNILSHPAVKFVHGDIDGDVYLENLVKWVRESKEKIAKGESEIPEGYSQGDLYLCPESLNAIQGAAATVCEAVDKVIASTRAPAAQNPPIQRAFVAIRPPGHHCGEDTPSGFCFLNNVAIGAAHAHLQHGIKRIVILDIDLHHGNGTQSIVWQINEETYRQTLESEGGGGGPTQQTQTGPRIYYGSIHDILSYPCEDGKPPLVQAASTSIHNAHGQYIENVHLQTYTSEEHFWEVLYKEEYSRLLEKAREFVESTGGEGDDVLVFISCGLDANEHEHPSMSRHNRKVPVGFYHRFARDASVFADRYARGRLVSVLEGGYSDRALVSGVMAHLVGLVGVPEDKGKEVDEGWWGVGNLVKLEAATKKRRGGRPSAAQTQTPAEPWLERALQIFGPLEAAAQRVSGTATRSTGVVVPRSDRTLRDRTQSAKGVGKTVPVASPSASSRRTGAGAGAGKGGRGAKPTSTASSASTSARTASTTRIIKIKPPSASASSFSTARAASARIIEREQEEEWETAEGEVGDSPLTSPSPSPSSSEDEGEDDDIPRHDPRLVNFAAATTITTATTTPVQTSDVVEVDIEDDGIEILKTGFHFSSSSGVPPPPAPALQLGAADEEDDMHRHDPRLVDVDFAPAAADTVITSVAVEGVVEQVREGEGEGEGDDMHRHDVRLGLGRVASAGAGDVGSLQSGATADVKKVPTRRVILKLGKPPPEVD